MWLNQNPNEISVGSYVSEVFLNLDFLYIFSFYLFVEEIGLLSTVLILLIVS